jgi:hypothetical protein
MANMIAKAQEMGHDRNGLPTTPMAGLVTFQEPRNGDDEEEEGVKQPTSPETEGGNSSISSGVVSTKGAGEQLVGAAVDQSPKVTFSNGNMGSNNSIASNNTDSRSNSSMANTGNHSSRANRGKRMVGKKGVMQLKVHVKETQGHGNRVQAMTGLKVACPRAND